MDRKLLSQKLINMFLFLVLGSGMMSLSGCKRKTDDTSKLRSTTSEGLTQFGCEKCHEQAQQYLAGESLHKKRGIACGQCHQLYADQLPPQTPTHEGMRDADCTMCHGSNIKKFELAGTNHSRLHFKRNSSDDGRDTMVSDQTCGKCHSEQYSQVLASDLYADAAEKAETHKKFKDQRRSMRNGDGNGIPYMKGGKIAKDMLCVACHYNDHKFNRPGQKHAEFFDLNKSGIEKITVRGTSQRLNNHDFPASAMRAN